MRIPRQNKILELIDSYEIGNQKCLASYLNDNGFEVTQATISRDIRELQLVKTLTASGEYKYIVSPQPGGLISSRHHDVFRNTVRSIAKSGNIVVVKCMPGCGNAAGEAVDSMELPNVIGSVAGDNTLMLVIDKPENTDMVVKELRRLLENHHNQI